VVKQLFVMKAQKLLFWNYSMEWKFTKHCCLLGCS